MASSGSLDKAGLALGVASGEEHAKATATRTASLGSDLT
jgi:hypothetical protein